MRQRYRGMMTIRSISAAALLLSAIGVGPAHAEPVPPPDLDCGLGFDGLQSFAALLPGAVRGDAGNSVSVAASEPDTWRAEFAFSNPGEAAHPVATMRTFIKQVTGVWTAQSKGCGFGDRAAFVAVMADMKATDKQLTDASRADAERLKPSSPLGFAP